METKKYTKEVEELFVQFFLTDPEVFVKCVGIVDEAHYEDYQNRETIRFMKEHVKSYSRLPTIEQISALTGKHFEKIQEYDPSYGNWCLDEYELFARHRQMERVIYQAPDLLIEGKYGQVEKSIKDAVSISLVKDIGLDYFSNVKQRLEHLRDNSNKVSTGWKTVDKVLYGGCGRGELTIWCAQSGHGKSIFLQNLAVNYVMQGLHVIYLSLELSEALCSMRMDAMTSGYSTTDIMRNLDDVSLKVSAFGKKHKGTLRIKQIKNGCTANDIKAFIKEYETQTKVKPDVILVDYLDLCMPASAKVSLESMFVKDKLVSEELRGLAVELNVIMHSASQLNRSAADSVEFGQQHIAGGKSKIDTADNVIAIYTTAALKEQGKYQLQFIKTRSSSGVGTTMEMLFDVPCLRVLDLPENSPMSITKSTTDVLSQLKRSNNTPDKKEDKNPLSGAMNLQSILSKLNSGN
jgi:archaellum biogenesis ATPase FlaH